MRGSFTPLLPAGELFAVMAVGKQGLFTPLLPAGELFAELLLARFALLACGCVCGKGRVLLNDELSNVHPGIDSVSFLFAILSKVDSYFRIMASRSDLACLFVQLSFEWPVTWSEAGMDHQSRCSNRFGTAWSVMRRTRCWSLALHCPIPPFR